MAMQTGVGLSKILILVGAGYSTTIMLKNGKLSDVLGELQSLVKGMEKSGEQSEGDSDYADAIAAQVRRLAMEVRQLSSSRQITILNGNSGNIGNLSSLIVPAATLGALGYGYMWWKGLSFSDLMYVTKRNMANAVSNLTKHLEHVSEALAATKRHLTQRIENLDDKMLKQNELSKLIKEDVAGVQKSLSDIDFDLGELHNMVSGLDGKLSQLEFKQDFATLGVMYLCNVVDGKQVKMPETLKEQFKISGKAQGQLMPLESPSLKGLKELTDTLSKDLTCEQPRALLRVFSFYFENLEFETINTTYLDSSNSKANPTSKSCWFGYVKYSYLAHVRLPWFLLFIKKKLLIE
ncbi:DUF1664 domain-containing protein [Cucumis melo var. makuwa]|uniref:DUF1664 domain-containing protein n=1 Tax=Cucumis melo var. makuwa TaxID=1194695 RepID=A0A5D3CQR8_CUCMM|nr:DUF1664 domain-containing protein [Cucumis melo var. makuwa]